MNIPLENKEDLMETKVVITFDNITTLGELYDYCAKLPKNSGINDITIKTVRT